MLEPWNFSRFKKLSLSPIIIRPKLGGSLNRNCTYDITRDFSRRGQRGHFAPLKMVLPPLNYGSMIKLISLFRNHKIYRLVQACDTVHSSSGASESILNKLIQHQAFFKPKISIKCSIGDPFSTQRQKMDSFFNGCNNSTFISHQTEKWNTMKLIYLQFINPYSNWQMSQVKLVLVKQLEWKTSCFYNQLF